MAIIKSRQSRSMMWVNSWPSTASISLSFSRFNNPLVTVMALDIGALFGGLIITEKIFSVPGMGRLFIDSLIAGDATVLVAWTIVTAMFIVVFNLIADVMYGLLDPRIRLS